jgi:autotransporter passenger strand-loop-strand repeat protein
MNVRSGGLAVAAVSSGGTLTVSSGGTLELLGAATSSGFTLLPGGTLAVGAGCRAAAPPII